VKLLRWVVAAAVVASSGFFSVVMAPEASAATDYTVAVSSQPRYGSQTLITISGGTAGASLTLTMTSASVDTQAGTFDSSGSYTYSLYPASGWVGHTIVVEATTLDSRSGSLTTDPVTSPFTSGPSGAWSISGGATVGSTLHVDVEGSDYSPTATEFEITWYLASGGPSVHTGNDWAVTSGMVGNTYYAQVDAYASANGHSRIYGPHTSYSSFVGAIGKGAFDSSSSPTIGSSARVGVALNVDTEGVWTPTPTSYSYQWRYADGTAVSGATDSSYTPTVTDLGKSLYVEVTGSRDGYTSNIQGTNLTGAVALREFSAGSPSVPSSARVGVVLSVDTHSSGWTPAPTSYGYQWRYADGTAISGATDSSYTPTTADLGKGLYVEVTASHDGYADYRTATNLTGAVALRSFVSVPTPQVSGTGLIGTDFTVDLGSTWSPEPSSIDCQWYRAKVDNALGTVIAGATGTSLTVTEDLVGYYVYVVVRGNLDEYMTYVIGSNQSNVVQETAGSLSLSEVARSGRVTVTGSGLLPDTTYSLLLHSEITSLGTATTDSEGTLTKTVTIPKSTSLGEHTISIALDGVDVVSLPVTVVAADSDDENLATTGPSSGTVPLAALGVLFTIAGLALIRRRIA
jgi:hypothetical protein